MDFVTIFFAVAVAWFSFIFFRIASWVYQFNVFPRTFGMTPNISLNDLAELSEERGQDLPGFNIVIPAYDESLVIDGTLRRMASINYPQTHFNVWVVTYEDEPYKPGEPTTQDVAYTVAEEINAAAGRDLVQVLSVPTTYDGRFPGNLNAKEMFVGKPRGLNFAIRKIHEKTEREERSLFVGRMARLGRIDVLDRAIDAVAEAADSLTDLRLVAQRFFDHSSPDYAGPCTLSTQLRRLAGTVGPVKGTTEAQHIVSYLRQEAPRFFQTFESPKDGENTAARGDLQVMEDRRFLFEVMRGVEDEGIDAVVEISQSIEARIARERPILWDAWDLARDGERLFHLARQVNSRWLATYDADADVPIDLFRHLGARILTEPETMGFQGPVSPVTNYDQVHPLCGLGGLWLAFWHNTGYPHLFAKQTWAHVLAGTNWCFRMDGLRRGAKIVRETEYDEAARHFILSFDPGHLTEDLEAGVRMFDELQINGSWHPYQEYEQVPETKQAMVVQRRRWTLGTLQTIAYMLRSRLPMLQKLKYGFHPIEILISGSGPAVTILLIYFIYTGDLISNPFTIFWSIVLTFANLMYVVPFLQTYERFVIGFRRQDGIEYLISSGPDLIGDIKRQQQGPGLAPSELALMHDIAVLLGDGLQEDGFVVRYLASRCLDTPPDGPSAEALTAATPAQLRLGELPALVEDFSRLTGYAFSEQNSATIANPALVQGLERMKARLEKSSSTGEWKIRRRKELRQVWQWAFVYLFWQLKPSYLGLLDWLRGSKDKTWVKTPRTRKGGAD